MALRRPRILPLESTIRPYLCLPRMDRLGRETLHLQTTESVRDSPCVNEPGLDEMQLLSFRCRNIHSGDPWPLLSPNHPQLSLGCPWQIRGVPGYDFPAVHGEKDVSGFNVGHRGSSPGMYILENPARPVSGIVREVACTERSTARCSASASMKETHVRVCSSAKRSLMDCSKISAVFAFSMLGR